MRKDRLPMPSEFLKTVVITPLQNAVASLNICPKCHKKTLESRYECEHFKALQCSICNTIYMLDSDHDRQVIANEK